MIKTILVPATGNGTDVPTFGAALAVARIFAAHIDALHVRVDPVDIAVAAAAGDGSGGGGALLGGLLEQLEQDAVDREAKARSIFTEFCAREHLVLGASPGAADCGPSAQWHVETGQETRWLAPYGMTSDLIVASRGVPGDDAAQRTALESLLLESGRPLLIPGAQASNQAVVEHVAIAWKPAPQAARAVAFAMPFLARAKTITVMTVTEEQGRRTDAERLMRYLAWHGMTATVTQVPPGADAAESLLAAVEAAKAGLLVMGGYGHTRLREWVFGGFTQRVLTDAPISVLLAH